MTVTTASKFKSLTYILTSQGFNLWDARIEARRLLGIKFHEPWRGKTPRFADTDRNRPENIPTVEDRLDVYFNSIVASCRSVVFGTVSIKPWSAYAGEWKDEWAPRNRSSYTIPTDEPKKKKSNYTPVSRPKGYWHMVKVLEANGMDYETARVKAQSILTD